jgi:hypothetical protein
MNIDWNEITRGYEASAFDAVKLRNYAKKVAKMLGEKKVKTDSVDGVSCWILEHTHRNWKEVESTGHEERDWTNEYWVLKPNGELFFYRSSGGDEWSPGFSLCEKACRNNWSQMNDGQALLLDHKIRSINKNNFWGTYLDSANYIAVRNKGTGCSKRLTDLLKTHNLYQPGTH